jgi:signal peptidase I
MKTFDILPSSTKEATSSPDSSKFFADKRQWQTVVFIALWSVLAYLIISHFILMAVQIKGVSMSPTLLDGDKYILYRCQYLWRAPRKGEIVVIKDPEDHDLSIKRIVALPDEVIEIRDDGVYVNSAKLPEPYLSSTAARASGHSRIQPTRLGPGQFFVMGDNRDFSADSRIYGPVGREAILGRINKTD